MKTPFNSFDAYLIGLADRIVSVFAPVPQSKQTEQASTKDRVREAKKPGWASMGYRCAGALLCLLILGLAFPGVMAVVQALEIAPSSEQLLGGASFFLMIGVAAAAWYLARKVKQHYLFTRDRGFEIFSGERISRVYQKK